MRIILIGSSANTRRKLVANRLRSAAATAAATALVLAFAIALSGRKADSVPASAADAERIVYAISYCGTDRETLDMLKNDLDHIRGLGLEFVLPEQLPELDKDGVILIIESTADPMAALDLFGEYSVPVVVVPPEDPDTELKARLLRLEDEGRIVLASYLNSVDGPWELARSIGEAGIDFAARFGRPCTVFIHECKGLVCSGCFSGAGDLLKDMTVFVFGNGVNCLAPGEKPLILNRIMRLPDWTIESYFSDIAK